MSTKPTFIKCACGVSFEWTSEGESISEFFKPTRCEKCEDEFQEKMQERDRQRQKERDAEEAALAAAKLRKVAADIERMTPERYLATDILHQCFNLKLWSRVKAWRPTATAPWLGLVGESGTCKTRVAFLLFRDIIMEAATSGRPITHEAVTAYGIADEVRRQYAKDGDNRAAANARSHLYSISDAGLLLIDDMGKARPTPAFVDELFAIVDYRHATNLPTIWTSNSPPESIAAGMGADMAGPFAGRLIECSNVINA